MPRDPKVLRPRARDRYYRIARGKSEKAAVGFEPTITDLQTVTAKPQVVAKTSSYQRQTKPLAPQLAPVRPKKASISPELHDLIDAWPELPEAVKAGILAMVNAFRKGEKQ